MSDTGHRLYLRVAWVSSAVIALATLGVFYAFYRPPPQGAIVDSLSLYTADDGKTWFEDDSSRVAPFPHGGGIAYRCLVAMRSDGSEPRVWCMIRCLPEAKAKIETQRQSGKRDWDYERDPANYEMRLRGRDEDWGPWFSAGTKEAFRSVLTLYLGSERHNVGPRGPSPREEGVPFDWKLPPSEAQAIANEVFRSQRGAQTPAEPDGGSTRQERRRVID